jgi:hypothetical protein
MDQILARDAEAALRNFNQGYLYGLEQAKHACVFEQRNARQFTGGGACIKAIERLIVIESKSSDTK